MGALARYSVCDSSTVFDALGVSSDPARRDRGDRDAYDSELAASLADRAVPAYLED